MPIKELSLTCLPPCSIAAITHEGSAVVVVSVFAYGPLTLRCYRKRTRSPSDHPAPTAVKKAPIDQAATARASAIATDKATASMLNMLKGVDQLAAALRGHTQESSKQAHLVESSATPSTAASDSATIASDALSRFSKAVQALAVKAKVADASGRTAEEASLVAAGQAPTSTLPQPLLSRPSKVRPSTSGSPSRRPATATGPRKPRQPLPSAQQPHAAQQQAHASTSAIPSEEHISVDRELLKIREEKAARVAEMLETSWRELCETEQVHEEEMAPLMPLCDTSAPLSTAIQRGRVSRGMAMLPTIECDQLVARCPTVFSALFNGSSLQNLVESGDLEACASLGNSASDKAWTFGNVSADNDHVVDFYIRELQLDPSSGKDLETILNEFAEAHPSVKVWVDQVKDRRHIRYVGLTIDGHPACRFEDDATAAKDESNTTKSKMLNFLALHSNHAWVTYKIKPLTTPLVSVNDMPINQLLAAFTPPTLPTVPMRLTREMLIKANNEQVAPIEAALIHLCSEGSACLNSAMYGGLDTLESQYHCPPWLHSLKDVVKDKCSFNGSTTSTSPLDERPRRDFRYFFELAKEEIGPNASQQLIESCSVHASVIPKTQANGGLGRLYHVLDDITLGDINGLSTRFGALTGPGLSTLRNAVGWALDNSEVLAEEGSLTLSTIGPSSDVWPLARIQRDLPCCCRLLRRQIQSQLLAGNVDALVLHSAEVFEACVTDRRLAKDEGGGPLRRRIIERGYLGTKVGTLHLVDLGNSMKLPAVVLLHGGLIKHSGDYLLRRDLHTLYRLVVLKARLLALSASIHTPTAAIDHTTQVAHEIGLETRIIQVRASLAGRYGAIARLRQVPDLRSHANSSDEDFRKREEQYWSNGKRFLDRRLIAEPARVAQVERLMEESGGRLDQLRWPKGVLTIAAMQTFIYEVETGADLIKTAGALRPVLTDAQRAARKAKPRGIELMAHEDRRYRVSPKTERTGFSSTHTDVEARWLLSTGDQTSGCGRGITAMKCSRCGRAGLVKIHKATSRHYCEGGQTTINTEDPIFNVEVLWHTWHIVD